MLEVEAFETIKSNISPAAAYEQLAEECVELAHAALKYARVLRGENPTPVGQTVAKQNVIEEISDLETVLKVLGVAPDSQIVHSKLERWAKRIENCRR